MHIAAHDLLQQELVDDVQQFRLILKFLLLREGLEFLVIRLRVRLQDKETHIIRKHILEAGRKVEIQSLRDDLLGGLESLPQYSVGSAALSNPILIVEVDGHVCKICDLEVCNLIIIDIVFIDLLGDDEETNEVFLLEHDLHLVKNEL